MKTFKQILEIAEPIFDIDSADELINKLNKNIKAPVINAYKSTLGGANNVSVILSLSLDPKDMWQNGIFENSRYMKMHISLPNVIEMISKGFNIKTKFRKSRAKDLNGVVKKINEYIKKVEKEVIYENF